MGKRSTGRKLAMQALYQADIRDQDLEEIIPEFIEASNFVEETQMWATGLARGAETHRPESDELIQTYAIGWDLDRINPIDRAILRLAFYELRHTDTPHNIVIDEALEISKRYSTDESPKFINGILGKYVEE